MSKPASSPCAAFEAAIQVLGRPWTGLILRTLQDGPRRFSELAEQMSGVGDKILSLRLKELESRGLLVRKVEAGPPVRVLYELTGKGQGCEHVIEAIERWGQELLEVDSKQRRRLG